MATKWFKKELCSNQIFFKNVPVAFECQPTNTGVIALDADKDGELIAFLDDCISKRKGGVGAIDAETYDAIKKNKTGKVSVAFLPQSRLQVLQVPGPSNRQKSAEAAAGRVSGGAGGERGNTAGDGAPFVPARGRVLNQADKTNPPG